jgi:signal transduction histidine kinase
MSDVSEVIDIISSISSDLDLDEILREITEKIAQLVGVDSCAISLLDTENKAVVVTADYISSRVANALDDFPAKRRVLRDKVALMVFVHDPTADKAERDLLKAFKWAGVLMLAMEYKGNAIGLMELYTDKPARNQFTEATVTICQALANQAAIAVENARVLRELDEKRAALRQISQRVIRTQEDERRRISRELHDELGQSLTALRLNIEVAQHSLPKRASPKLARSIEEAGRLVARVHETTHNLALDLRPAMIDDLGLVSTLHWEFDRYEQLSGQTVDFETDLVEGLLQPEMEISIYRIVSEALTNVYRHANASQVRVMLLRLKDSVVVTVEDDGIGFNSVGRLKSPTKRESLGLVSMKERAELLGGRLQVISDVGRGTKIQAEFPLN